MAVYEVIHSLIQHKLGLLRKSDLSTKQFREQGRDHAGGLSLSHPCNKK